MFSAYHSIQAEFVRDFELNASIQVQTDKFWVLFAQSMSTEAVDRALCRTLFDHAQLAQFFGFAFT